MFVPRILVVLLAGVALTACSRPDANPDSAISSGAVVASAITSNPVVVVQRVEPQRIDRMRELPGRIQAVRTAQVRARVSGIVKRRLFEEGSEVQAGQVLYELETAPYEIALERARATVVRAKAAVAEAQATANRYVPLAKVEAVSQQDLLTAQTALATAKANLASSVAEEKSSKLDLDYATIRAPIGGKVGRSLITEGALVGQDEATILTTIQQIDSVFADVTQSVSELMQLRSQATAGPGPSGSKRIVARVDGTEKTREGRLLFSEVSVDPSSGNVTLRGEFDNKDGLLLPGMYVRISVSQGSEANAFLIPQRAVRFESSGAASVWLVNDQQLVEKRAIKTGEMVGTSWHVLEGLQNGDLVITDAPDIALGQAVTAKSGVAAVTPVNSTSAQGI